jgi:hypothetical protein
MENPYQPPETDDPQRPTASRQYDAGFEEPHRGGMILAMGICSLAVCFICGVVAWSMANRDLPKMEAGQMNHAGMGLTRAGRTMGIAGIIMDGIGIVLVLLMLLAGDWSAW